MYRALPSTARLVAAPGLAMLALATAAWSATRCDNYHPVIAGELYRSGRMTLRQLAAHTASDRLAAVINLCPETDAPWHVREAAWCRRHGLVHVDVPLAGDAAPSLADMQTLAAAMERIPKPVVIHCTHGADRTGLAVALYLLTVRHRTPAESARALSLRFGHLPVGRMRCFDAAFAACSRARQAGEWR